MKRFKDFKVGTKIAGVVLLAVGIMVVAAGFGIIKLQEVGHELDEIASRDIPLSNAVTRLEVLQLEQMLEFERTLRLSARLAQGDAVRARFEEEVEKLDKMQSEVAQALSMANALCAEATADPDLSSEARVEFDRVAASISELSTGYGDFNQSVSASIKNAREGRLAELEETVEKGEHTAELQFERIEALAKELAGFTALAADRARAAEHIAIQFIAICSGAGLALGGLLAWLIARSIQRPIRQAADLLQRVAHGDLTSSVNYESRDEIGEICAAANAMVVSLRKTVATLARGSDSLAHAATELSAVSAQVSSTSEETASQSTVVASAAEQISQSVSTVATASEEMNASIREIAHQTSQAAETASQASRVVEETNTQIGKLGVSSEEIGAVIKVITGIAEQTNLLALNATIEAARAGEAGKGFAVVATEVKELAKQTRLATEEIRAKIVSIQTDSTTAVGAMRQISDVIKRINDIQSMVASSIEEQAATMNEISSNSSEAANGSGEIARNILNVSQAAAEATEAATRSSHAARNMTDLATQLTEIVGQFTIEDPAATAPASKSGGEVVHRETLPRPSVAGPKREKRKNRRAAAAVA